jgi:hypothetical protein
MLDELVTRWLRWLGKGPCFRIYGKTRRESDWRLIDIYATRRRDRGSGLPLWDGTCTTWSSTIISVGWDFAENVLREQRENPASRDYPIEVAGGRIRNVAQRTAVGAPSIAYASEVLAHECGHTWQALRLDLFYLPLVGSVTLFREGPYPWNHFENEASEQGQFGGIVNGSVCDELMKKIEPA